MKTRWLHNLLHKAGFIDDGALLFLTFIDIVLAVVFFISCSIDLLTMIGLIALGVLIPIVKVRSWLKLKKGVAIVWACVTFFAGVNFMLTTITVQDAEAVPAYVTEAKITLKSLQDQQTDFRNKNQRTNANAMQESIDKAQAALTAAETRASQEETHVKALAVFGRIPELFTKPNAAIFIALVFYSIIFFGIESTIGTIALEMGRVQPEKPTPAAPASVKKPKKKSQPKKLKPKPAPVERFEDITDQEYREAAEGFDGQVDPPEVVAARLGITEAEAHKKHAELFAGYVFRDGKYVRYEGVV